MFVFVYGSLMRDGWERAFDGTRYDGAVLPDFRRDFNKASTERWGTRERPAPTLGLEPEPGASCVGCAFEFSPERDATVRAYLERREGPDFDLPDLPVTLPDGRSVSAMVPVNRRNARSYLGREPVERRAVRALVARGAAGSGEQYVRDMVRSALLSLSISDKNVDDMWNAMQEWTLDRPTSPGDYDVLLTNGKTVSATLTKAPGSTSAELHIEGDPWKYGSSRIPGTLTTHSQELEGARWRGPK